MAATDGTGAFSLVDNGEAYYYALFPGRFLRAFPRGNALSRSVALDVSLGVDVGVGGDVVFLGSFGVKRGQGSRVTLKVWREHH